MFNDCEFKKKYGLQKFSEVTLQKQTIFLQRNLTKKWLNWEQEGSEGT